MNTAPRAVAGFVRQSRILIWGRANFLHPALTTTSGKMCATPVRSYVQPAKFYCMPIQTIDVRENDVVKEEF
jgi:hypothetical protein